MSDWYLASSPHQVTATLGTPEVRFSLDSSSIRILLKQMENGRVAESIALEGKGVGAGLGVGITVPFLNASVSTTDTPGVGTWLWQTPFSPRHMTAHNFKGVCWAMSGSHADVGAQAGAVVLMFCDEASPTSARPGA